MSSDEPASAPPTKPRSVREYRFWELRASPPIVVGDFWIQRCDAHVAVLRWAGAGRLRGPFFIVRLHRRYGDRLTGGRIVTRIVGCDAVVGAADQHIQSPPPGRPRRLRHRPVRPARPISCARRSCAGERRGSNNPSHRLAILSHRLHGQPHPLDLPTAPLVAKFPLGRRDLPRPHSGSTSLEAAHRGCAFFCGWSSTSMAADTAFSNFSDSRACWPV